MKVKLVLALSSFALTSFVGSAQGIPSRPAENSQLNPSHDKRRTVSIAANYGKLPLSFEANQGQSDPQVRFLSRGVGYSLFLTDKAAVLALTKSDGIDSRKKADFAAHPQKQKTTTDVVRMQLVGARTGFSVAGDERLPGTANYFVGNDPKKW